MYLGIDLGTSEVKILLLDDSQQVIARASEALTVSRPQPLWSEQLPHDWWAAAERGIASLKQTQPQALAAVKGIGLSGQMHGAVLLDKQDQVLRPAILWNDVRAGAQCQALEKLVPQSRHITGNLAMPGFTAPKLLWVAEHEPEVFQRTVKVLLPKDFLRLKLSGEYISDLSDAAGTLWLDVQKRDWSDVMLSACGLNRGHMPRLVEGCAPGGVLRSELARAWGVGEGVVIAGGAGDNAASAIGMGVVANGQAMISLGTSGVFFVANDRYLPNPEQGVHTFCHALPQQWHQMAVILSAASCLRWVTQVTNAKDEAALLEEIEAAPAREFDHAPLFLPYLSGERTPHNNPHAKGVWFGLSHDTSRAALGYAVLEGVAFALLDGYRALQEAGATVNTVSLVGGGSKSRYWSGLLANVLGLPMTRHSGGDFGAAFGAARLAMMATNPGADVSSICLPPPVIDIIEAEVGKRDRLLQRHEQFRKIYNALRPLFSDTVRVDQNR
jgi:xylulokinase